MAVILSEQAPCEAAERCSKELGLTDSQLQQELHQIVAQVGFFIASNIFFLVIPFSIDNFYQFYQFYHFGLKREATDLSSLGT